MSSEVRIVVFDLGGVVVRICRSLKEACAAAGVRYHEEAVSPEKMVARKGLVRKFEIGEMEPEAFFAQVAATTDGLYTATEFAAIHQAWILHEYDGVANLIDELHARNIPTGVLSNTNHAHWLQLADHPHLPGHRAKFPTPGKVKHLHASHLLKLAKPDRAIYDEFAKRSGHEPREILFFDDLVENVEAARSAGWKSEVIDHAGDTATQMRGHLQRWGVL